MKKYLFLFSVLISTKVFAATITVASIAELQVAIDNAKPGDVIQVKNGVYTTTADIVIANAGRKGRPITIAAQNSGAAEITGISGFSLVKPASYIIIKGFKFTHAA